MSKASPVYPSLMECLESRTANEPMSLLLDDVETIGMMNAVALRGPTRMDLERPLPPALRSLIQAMAMLFIAQAQDPMHAPLFEKTLSLCLAVREALPQESV